MQDNYITSRPGGYEGRKEKKMLYTRIKSYLNGEFTGCEHLYFGNNHVKALNRFRKEYPEHKDCILIAETIESENLKYKEYFQACLNSGCVH